MYLLTLSCVLQYGLKLMKKLLEQVYVPWKSDWQTVPLIVTCMTGEFFPASHAEADELPGGELDPSGQEVHAEAAGASA